MKKGLKITGIVLSAGVLLGIGTVAGASGLDWKQNAINDSYNQFLDTASQSVNKLTGNVDKDIQNQIDTNLQGTIDEQQAQLEKLLKEYYQMKIDGLTTDNPEFKALEEQIKVIQKNVLDAYKGKIDEAIKGK